MNTINTQNKKRLAATIIITLMALSSILAIVPLASAISTPALTVSNGPVGTEVTVSGIDASVGSLVQIYWDNLGGAMLGSTYADGTGAYSKKVTVPETVAGTHYFIVNDAVTPTASAAFIVEPKITRDVTSGLPGDTIVVTGTGFGNAKALTVTFDGDDVTPSGSPKSSALGSFSLSIEVPDLAYGSYTIVVTDASTNTANVAFTIGATISLSPTSGPTGTVVTVSGRGFTEDADPALNIVVTIGATTLKQVAPIKTLEDGTFSGQVIIPTTTAGDKTVSATDGTFTATATYKVSTGKTTKITVTPALARAGTSVDISGQYFTAIAGTTVTVKFDATTIATFTTDANGAFSGTITIPIWPEGAYTITATDAKDLTANKAFTIATVSIAITPSSGPTGTEVVIAGYGFTVGDDATITIDDAEFSTTVAELAAGTASFIVPQIAAGTYTITVEDENDKVATATFTVTEVAEVNLSPSAAPHEYEVDLEVNYFPAGTPLTITLMQGDEVIADLTGVLPGPVTTGADGSYYGWFVVDFDWDFGAYTIVVDGGGFTVETAFAVAEVEMTISTGIGPFCPDGSVAFYMISNLDISGAIVIYDANGYPFDAVWVYGGEWVYVGADTYVYPLSWTMTWLPSNAAVGTWSWEAYFGEFEGAGTFDVVAKSAPEQGPAGPAGPAGPTGATGPAGATGAAGAAGATGPAGATGAAGSAGATGAAGPAGATGPAGTGAAGPAGAAGTAGATGPAGAAGTAGLAGAKGDTGAAGPAGATGPAGTGAAGLAGAKGDTGPAGATGPTGPAGADGAAAPETVGGPAMPVASVALAVVALIVGMLAAFIAITLRRKIAS